MTDTSRSNAIILVTSYWLTKLGDALASAKTTLPWLLASLGAPAFIQGLLVPIRESGSLIPQMLFSHYVKRYALRKGIFAIGSAVQAICIFAIAMGAYYFDGWFIGCWVLGWLGLFSGARAFCSIASKDVLGKAVAKDQRGKLTGLSATLAGLISIGIGALLLMPGFKENTLLLLWIAVISWLLAAVLYWQVSEPYGETEQGKLDMNSQLQLARRTFKNTNFRQFIAVRSLLMSSALALPFIVTMANQYNALGLGGYIIASGIASLISGRVWGALADRSSKAVLIICALLTCIVCTAASISLLIHQTPPFWLCLVLFFILAVTHEGVRVGRQIYVVNLAEDNQRTDFVAVGNTIIGILLLIIGIMSALLASMHLIFAFGLFATATALASWRAFQLKAV